MGGVDSTSRSCFRQDGLRTSRLGGGVGSCGHLHKVPDGEKSAGQPSRLGAQAHPWERECLGVWGAGRQEGRESRLARTQELGCKGCGFFFLKWWDVIERIQKLEIE